MKMSTCLLIALFVSIRCQAETFQIDSVAGDGKPTDVGQPFGVEFGPDGELYICEVENHRIRSLDLKTGEMESIAGTGRPGYHGDGGSAKSARMNEPYEIRFDGDGNIFVVEMKNHIVRRIDAKTKLISTVAGNGKQGFSGDGGAAVDAQLDSPHSIALDGDNGLLIADIGNHRIRRVDLSSGRIDTIAGTGERVQPVEGQIAKGNPILGPRALFVEGKTLWIALREGHSVWTLNLRSGNLSHIAGTGEKGYSGDGGAAKNATFNGPKGIAVGPNGNVFIVDTENQAIRKINLADNSISTIAGGGPTSRGYAGDGGSATAAKLDRPHGVCVGANGHVFVGDTNNHRVRRIQFSKDR